MEPGLSSQPIQNTNFLPFRYDQAIAELTQPTTLPLPKCKNKQNIAYRHLLTRE
jgi:hypothetical protein